MHLHRSEITRQSRSHPYGAAWLATLLLLSVGSPAAERIPKPGPIAPVPSSEWIAQVGKLAPAAATAKPRAARKVLVFHLFTGFHHAVIPYANEALKAISEHTQAFDVVFSTDIENFSEDRLKSFDGVILNNCCSVGGTRNLFLDVLGGNISDPRYKPLADPYRNLTDEQRKTRAAELEKNLLNHVSAGHGLIGVHGGIVMQNNSSAFSEMFGGSFDYHPKSQELTVYPVDADHPLLKVFKGEPFIHTDEPYLFSAAYARKQFHPLLKIHAKDVEGKQANKPVDDILYVSWIKRYGQGRVFYVSPSHYPDTYLSATLLRFYLDGIQYALGDLDCDDAPLGR
jgi:type 1 glutamine amidotransferase